MESRDSEPTSSALVRKRDDDTMGLMLPPPPPKRIKRPKTVVDEESYTEGLSRIIARDFFPGLLESETQQEYLDALDSKDEAWISSASRRLQQVMTPGRRRMAPGCRSSTPLRDSGQTPRGYVGDTPASAVSTNATTEVKTTRLDTNMSLSAFQAKYTSEDNESFYKLLDRQNQKRAEKYAWLWNGNKMPSKMQIKQKEIELKISKTRTLEDDGFRKDRLAIKDKDDRPAGPTLWKTDPQNSLMFGPAGMDESIETVAQRAQAESRAEPKSIVYANTKMPDPNVRSEASIAPSPSLSAVRDAIAGKPREADQDSGVGGGETPRVNGYAFVDDEEPEPEATPAPVINLGPGDSTPNPFKLGQQRKREALHHRMVDRIAESKRASARAGGTGRFDQTSTTPLGYPSSPSVSGSLTPAAQRLWTRIGNAGKSGRATPFNGKTTPRTRTPLLSGTKRTPRQ